MFDIESINPSISEKHFNDSINFAKSTCDITDDDIIIIMQSRKTKHSFNKET